IRDRRRVLHGPDVLADMPIDDTFYRAQVEHELRAKMVRLRQKAAGVLAERDLLLRLMCDSLSTFCVLFRHALRLSGQPPVFPKRAVVTAACRHWNLEPEPFDTLLALREGTQKQTDVHEPRALFTTYLAQINRVVGAVNELVR
ncbi:MAG TPA: hypothetical protein VES20_03070, partial [Bryobacteraceae bacterium]|nr:hypothetical protein [Bryobacteraceae bacterium]